MSMVGLWFVTVLFSYHTHLPVESYLEEAPRLGSVGGCVWSLFCCTVLKVISSFAKSSLMCDCGSSWPYSLTFVLC